MIGKVFRVDAFMLKPHILDFYGAGKGDNMEIVVGKKKIRIKLSGRIDSNNSAEFESDLVDMVSKHADKDVELDMANLEYISSAGLRVLLKLRKMKKKTLDIINVNDDVFEIFGVTGFIELFNLSKRMKSITLMPAEILMRSVNGAFYRQNGDTMVKVYKKGVSLDQVKQERELARTALIMRVPTLIPYEVGMVGDCYGILFEASDSLSLAKEITKKPEKMGHYAIKLADFMKELHEIKIKGDVFPSIKERYWEWLDQAKGLISENDRKSLVTLIDKIPDDEGYVHGNINLGNIVVNGEEFLLLDMSASAYGASLFDLQNLYATLVEVARTNPTYCSSQFGISAENSLKFWDLFYNKYMADSAQGTRETMLILLKQYYILNDKLLSVLEKN